MLEVIERERLVDNAREIGKALIDGLDQLAERYEVIGDVRGAGLFVGLELVKDRAAKTPDAEATARIVNGLREKRVLISSAGPYANVLKIRPPLVFGKAEVEIFLSAFDDVLAGL